ETRSKSSL
ncbi:uroporphyrinogen-III synthase HemD family protein, partial [Vibrio parahaemolyticus V-223/04]